MRNNIFAATVVGCLFMLAVIGALLVFVATHNAVGLAVVLGVVVLIAINATIDKKAKK